MNTKAIMRVGVLLLLQLALPASASAGDWSGWWLPKGYSVHGPAIDSLFTFIFWLTAVIFILVHATLIVFLIKYRRDPSKKKAVFTHGNRRLEFVWTITPAIMLLILALFSKGVWDHYRYSPIGNDPGRAKILVIGQQFKWNTIYPGPDGELGRYLIFPKPTDMKWPDPRPAAMRKGPFLFPEGKGGVPGPAFLPHEKAIKAINDFNELNPLGKDFDDPAGKDDIYEGALAREIVLPANRPIEVQVTSKDVIHDFFLPNFRVKLDAVPGMIGKLYFEGTTTSRSLEEHKVYRLDDLAKMIDSSEMQDFVVEVDPGNPHALMEFNKSTKLPQWRYVNEKKETIIRAGSGMNAAAIDRLKSAGFGEITLYKPYVWELVCEQFCGQGHGTMRGQLRFVTNDEYDSFHYDRPYDGTAAPVSLTAGTTAGKIP